MKPYRFRLNVVQKLRVAHRDAQRVRLTEAQLAADVLNAQQQTLSSELGELQELHRTEVQEQRLDMSRLADSQRYELLLRAQQKALSEQAVTIEEEVERRRMALAEAEREVKALDKLAERGQEEHRREQERLATKELDELASVRHAWKLR